MSFLGKLKSVFSFKKSSLPPEETKRIESFLLESDVSSEITAKIVKNLEKCKDAEEVAKEAKSRILKILEPAGRTLSTDFKNPFVIFITGVNGGGKTTTIGKLAHRFVREEKKVLISACDTFRAGAASQLSVWAQRAGASLEAPLKEGEDPASVGYRSLKRAIDEKFDVLLVDTSGRLQVNRALMDELTKMQSVIKKIDSSKPDLSLLVIDGSAGQNAIAQAREFSKAVKVDGVCVTKLDSSSKGGALLEVASELGLGIYFAAFGEDIEDIANFDAQKFVDGMFKE